MSSIEAFFILMLPYWSASSMVPFTLNTSVFSISGSRSLPFAGRSQITIIIGYDGGSLLSSVKNVCIRSLITPDRLAEPNANSQSTIIPLKAAATSSRLWKLAALILRTISLGDKVVVEELGVCFGVGLGKGFSAVGTGESPEGDVGAEGNTAGEGITDGLPGTIAVGIEDVGAGFVLSRSHTNPWNHTKAAVIANTTPNQVNQIAPSLK